MNNRTEAQYLNGKQHKPTSTNNHNYNNKSLS